MPADFSVCICQTAGFYNYWQRRSGKVVMEFDLTASVGAGGAEQLIAKPASSTSCTDITRSSFWIEKIIATSTGSNPRLFDGTDNDVKMVGPFTGTSIVSTGRNSIELDFGKDPIACLTADTTKAICFSNSTGIGGPLFIFGYWGQA